MNIKAERYTCRTVQILEKWVQIYKEVAQKEHFASVLSEYTFIFGSW